MDTNSERVRGLIRQLVDTETALQEILGVDLDAVLDPSSGTPLLLRRAQAEMYLLLRQLPAVVWSTDAELRLTSVLGAGLEILDLVPGQVLGRSLAAQAPAGLGGRLALTAHVQALQGWPVAFDFEFQGRTFQAHVEPLVGSRGQVDGCLGMALDITARARAEAELRRLRDELEARVEDQTADLRQAAVELEMAAIELRVQNEDLLVAHQALDDERHRYRDLFDFAPDGYLVTDRFGTIREANQAAGRLLASEPGLLAGQSLVLAVAEADRPALLTNLHDLQAGTQKQAVQWELRFQARGGRPFDAAVTVAPMAPAAGHDEPAGLRWLIRDVSERRQAENDRNAALEAAQTSEERLRLLADFTYDWEYWTGPGGEYLYVSPSCERVSGYSAADFMGDPGLFPRLVHPDDLPAVLEHRRAKIETPGPREIEFRIITRQGQERWIGHVCQPVSGGDGRPLGWRGSNRDITERKLAEMERDGLLYRMRSLLRLAEEVLAEKSLTGLLQRIVDAACELTGARVGVTGHGYRDGRFVVGASARAPELSPCPPGENFSIEQGGVYLELIKKPGSLRLGQQELLSHPAWWGLPAGHASLNGLLGTSLLARDGQPNGLVMVSDKTEGEFTAEDEAVLCQLAALASLALQHVEARLAAEAHAGELAEANDKLLVAHQELQQQNEEIQVAEEELRQQNDELRNTRQELEQERQRYLELFEFAPDGYLVTDLQGTLQAANRAAAELLGVEARFLIGKPLVTFVAGPDRAVLSRCLREVRRDESEPWRGEVRLQPRGAQPLDAALTVTHAGTSLRWLIRDVTERKQAAAEREQLLARAQEAQRRSEEQAALLDAVVTAIADGLVLYDAQGGITRLNAIAEAMLCYSPAERDNSLAERVARRQPLDDQGRPLAAHEVAASRALRGETVQGQILGLRPAGPGGETLRWVSASAAPVRDDSGRLLGAVATFADITELRQARQELERRVEERTAALRQTLAALQASEERYRTVSELTSDYIYQLAVDGEGPMVGTLVTTGFTRLTGFELDEVKDMANWRKFMHPDDLPRAVEFFGSVLAARQPASIEIRMLTRAGEVLWTELSARPVFDDGRGRVVAIEGAVKDITERHRMQATLIQAERLGIAGRLAASLAHEINNPLQSAIGCLDLAREALDEGDDPGRFLDVVSAALQRATGVVAQLRGLHRPIVVEDRHPVLISSIVEQLLVLTRKRCHTAGVEVVCEVGSDLPPLPLQRDSINQVFLNLVLNALDAMAGGGELRISTQATAEPEGVWVRFEDTGPGLAPEIEAHLFEPFHSTKDEGLGLGLFISNNIVQQHGGRIVVGPRAGGGTVFGVWLPA